MKKATIFILSLILIIGLFSISAYAEDTGLNIVETPDLKIVINGERSAYTDTPLIVNDRTMLPLREVLVNLGVPNDEEHIIWDGDTQTITIVTDDKNIMLKIDSNIAYIGEEDVTLDVAPMLYAENWRTYIPARFVSEAMDKKVAWDGTNRAVIVTSQESYKQVLGILNQCDEAMADVTKFKFDMDYDIIATENDEDATIAMDFTGEMDTDNNASHIDLNLSMISPNFGNVPVLMTMEHYIVGDTAYATASLFGMNMGWTEESPEDQETFIQEDIVAPIEANEVVASGLVVGESEDEDIIVLKGSILLDQLVNEPLISDMSETEQEYLNISDYYVEIGIDADTYEMIYFHLTLDLSSQDAEGQLVSANIIMNMNFSDYNGDFEIVVPQEVIDEAAANAATEAEETIEETPAE
jgi:hypothetical protein